MSLVAVEVVSLDGVMQGPGRPDEDLRGGFDLGGWASRVLADDPEAAQAAMGRTGGTAALLFGHTTYVDLVGHWLSTPEPNPFTDVIAAATKYVASRDAGAELPYPNSVLLPGEATDTVPPALAETDGDVVVLGSGALVRSLAAASLVDRYVLTVLPVVLGRGQRLFEGTAADLRLEDSHTFPSGVQVTTYAVAR